MLSSDNNGPCRDCKNRTITCHGECKAYLEWREQIKALNEKIRSKAKLNEYGWCEPSKKKGKRK